MTGEKFRSKIVDDFYSNFTSGSTIRGYRCHLKYFFEVIVKSPDTYIVDTRGLENGERLYLFFFSSSFFSNGHVLTHIHKITSHL